MLAIHGVSQIDVNPYQINEADGTRTRNIRIDSQNVIYASLVSVSGCVDVLVLVLIACAFVIGSTPSGAEVLAKGNTSTASLFARSVALA